MRRSALALVFLWIACGSVGPKPCSAAFSGNFTDSSSGPRACPSLEVADGGWRLAFQADAPTANTTIQGSISLGVSPRAATLTSQSAVGDWSARGTREPGCLYAAGAGATPHGSFLLTLRETSVDAGTAHGTLEVVTVLHPLPESDCGPGDAETISLEF